MRNENRPYNDDELVVIVLRDLGLPLDKFAWVNIAFYKSNIICP